MLSQSQVLLIDSTRGLCKADGGVISLLRKAGVPILPVLTKADLLSPEELAKSHTIVQAQLDLASKNRPVGREQHELNVGAMISSHFLAGIENLWTLLDQRVLDQRLLEQTVLEASQETRRDDRMPENDDLDSAFPSKRAAIYVERDERPEAAGENQNDV